MSEPPAIDEYAGDYPGDQTQPTAEILNALNSPVKSEPPPDLPTPTEYDALTAELKEKPHNPEAWRRLVEIAENSGEIDKIRATFEALLKQYPNTVCCDINISIGIAVVSDFCSSVVRTNCIYQSLLE